ncbi:MAG: S-adenosylmethionine:tRNA ribosyltransferase-isomerase [Bacteroidia bacterium]|jgi:S-adenosylmethionine:tRNA ribosyltransferase-isomerase
MSVEQKQIKISDYDYDLPQQFIAQRPLSHRADSKLLVYGDGHMTHNGFSDIVDILPKNALLVFNNTKVIPARLFVTKHTGAVIQVFLLNPVLPYTDVERALKSKNEPMTWSCIIGNLKRWKDGETLQAEMAGVMMEFTLKNRDKRLVEMTWTKDVAFCDAIDVLGNMPLPPYIKREAQEADETRYQTVYAKHDGAVAAPTAGLHFTASIIEALKEKGVTTTEVTLHVGAGTFKPVEDDLVWNHPMHEEYYQVSLSSIEALITDRPRIATGTTSLRTLETLYWVGVQLRDGLDHPLNVAQHLPYLYNGQLPSYNETLSEIVAYMSDAGITDLVGVSGIMIMPGYDIKSVTGLITNFHLPKSTLLLLIAALVGEEWKRIYSEAKQNNYRFLSYGDSSLLLK